MKIIGIRRAAAVLLAAALLLGSVPAVASNQMVVATGNTGWLNLREYPSTDAAVVGQYYSGTVVTCYGIANGWAYVSVGGQTGYMMAAFLSGCSPAPTAAPYPDFRYAQTYYVSTGNSGRLHLRQSTSASSASLGLYPNGTRLQGVDQGNGWVYCLVDGQYGYMMGRYLSLRSVAPTVRPTAAPSGPYVQMVVATGNSGRLYLRAAPSKSAASMGRFANGTYVMARDLGNGWAQVQVNGLMGYMMLRYLRRTVRPVITAVPCVTPVPAPTAAPRSNTATVWQKNGSYVNLRSTKASKNNSNVIAKIESGTVVDVLDWGGTYTLVRYRGMTGYIVTSYLIP